MISKWWHWTFSFFYYQWEPGKVSYSSIDAVSDNPFSFQVGMPLALLYKSGGEVSLNPENKTLFSIGAGFGPTLLLSGYGAAGSDLFKLRTFAMAEVGFLALRLN